MNALDDLFPEEAKESDIEIGEAIYVFGLLVMAKNKLKDGHPAKPALANAADILKTAIVETEKRALAEMERDLK